MKTLADIEAPNEVTKVQLEADLQDQCVRWIRARGWWARKFSSISQRSVPDYIFAKKGLAIQAEDVRRLKFFTEFKKPGTKPKLIEKYGVTVMSTEAQYEEQRAMIAAGWIGFECSSFDKFKHEVERIELTCCTSER